MNPKQRVKYSLTHREPDRVPVSDQLVVSRVSSGVLGRHTYTGGGEFARDTIEALLQGRRDEIVEKCAEDTVELHEKLDLDFVNVGLNPPQDIDRGKLPQKLDEYTYRYEDKQEGTFTIRRFSPESGQFFEIDSSLRKEGIEELEKLSKNWERQLSEEIKFDPSTFQVLDYIIQKAGETRAISSTVGLGIPMAQPAYMEAMLLKPEIIELFLDLRLKNAIAMIHELAKHGVDFLLGGGDLANNQGPYYSPSLFRKLMVPRYRKLLQVAHRYNLPYIFRSDGNTRPLWDIWFKEIGIDGYGEIDANAGMDLGELKGKYGNEVILLGNVNCATTLVYGSKRDIFNEVKDCIRKAAPGGSYILTSSNSIHYNVPPENFLYMVEATKKFGKY